MNELLANISARAEQVNIILLIGIAIFAGTVGARIIQKLHIPQIIGYVTIGVILGPLLNVISPQTVETLEPFNLFALGVIGFLIGGELKREIFVKFGRQVMAILLFEGLAAFLLVGGACFLVLCYFYDWHMALAIGVVFGAICAATDPASTMNVLWEYKTRGPLTTMLTAVVALDDALALILYIASISLATFLTGHKEVGFLRMIFHSFYEVIGSLGLGLAVGLILRWIIKQLDDDEKTLIFTISTIVLSIGLAISLKFDVILSSMACGVTLINFSPRRSLADLRPVFCDYWCQNERQYEQANLAGGCCLRRWQYPRQNDRVILGCRLFQSCADCKEISGLLFISTGHHCYRFVDYGQPPV